MTTHTTFIVRLHLRRPQVPHDVNGLDSVSIGSPKEVFVLSSMRLTKVPWSHYACHAYVVGDQCTASGEATSPPSPPSSPILTATSVATPRDCYCVMVKPRKFLDDNDACLDWLPLSGCYGILAPNWPPAQSQLSAKYHRLFISLLPHKQDWEITRRLPFRQDAALISLDTAVSAHRLKHVVLHHGSSKPPRCLRFSLQPTTNLQPPHHP